MRAGVQGDACHVRFQAARSDLDQSRTCESGIDGKARTDGNGVKTEVGGALRERRWGGLRTTLTVKTKPADSRCANELTNGTQGDAFAGAVVRKQLREEFNVISR
jgi:hypothetical protein